MKRQLAGISGSDVMLLHDCPESIILKVKFSKMHDEPTRLVSYHC